MQRFVSSDILLPDKDSFCLICAPIIISQTIKIGQCREHKKLPAFFTAFFIPCFNSNRQGQIYNLQLPHCEAIAVSIPNRQSSLHLVCHQACVPKCCAPYCSYIILSSRLTLRRKSGFAFSNASHVSKST